LIDENVLKSLYTNDFKKALEDSDTINPLMAAGVEVRVLY
jgi:hypothetical protein